MWLEISSWIRWYDISKVVIWERVYGVLGFGWHRILFRCLFPLMGVIFFRSSFNVHSFVQYTWGCDFGHTVRPYLPRYGLACILAPVLLGYVHLPFVIFHYNHGWQLVAFLPLYPVIFLYSYGEVKKTAYCTACFSHEVIH